MNDEKKLMAIFRNGYGYIPKSIMKFKKISIQAKALYAYICTYAGTTGKAYPSRKLICYDLNISSNSLSKYMKELVTYGLIRKNQNRKNGMRFDNNIYTINFDVDLSIEEPLTKSLITEDLSEPFINSDVSENLVEQKTVKQDICTNNNNYNNNNTKNINIIRENNQIVEDAPSLEELKSLTNKYIKYDNIKSLVNDYIDFKATTKKPFTSEKQFIAFINSLNSITEMQSQVDCLEYSLRNNYTDIYPERFRRSNEVSDFNRLKKQDDGFKRETLTENQINDLLNNLEIL